MSAITRWTLRTDPTNSGKPFWFYIYVYETPEDLRRAAAKYRDEDGVGSFVDTVGCFQPNISVKYAKNKQTIRTASTTFVGCMRLCRPNMQQFVIIHESVHAAMNLCRAMAYQQDRGDPDYEDIEWEEALAYATHHISRALLAKAKMR